MGSRRDFLQSAGASLAVVGNGLVLSPMVQQLALADVSPPRGGRLLGILKFTGERRSGRPFGEKYGDGLSGRLVYDLTKLNPANLTIPNDQFFIRTSFPDRLDLKKRDPWKIHVSGLVEEEMDLPLPDLQRDVKPMGVHLLECSGNTKTASYGLMSAAQWSGIPIDKVLDRIPISRQATRVKIAGFDDYSQGTRRSQFGASWIFTRDQLSKAGAFLATQMNGEPLPKDHGFPIRLIMPGWYGCVSAKWVTDIELVDESAPATSQMREFASRTHQRGNPRKANQFQPATMQQAAMPVRVEKWRANGLLFYRVVGILWGGQRPTDRLMIRFNRNRPYVPVESYDHTTNATWNVWTHSWYPDRPGEYQIRMKIDDPFVPTRRLDRGQYARTVEVTDV